MSSLNIEDLLEELTLNEKVSLLAGESRYLKPSAIVLKLIIAKERTFGTQTLSPD